jgi:putative nucleotidyltransferase with HDIG domain
MPRANRGMAPPPYLSTIDGSLSRQSVRLLASIREHHPPTADHSIRVATVMLAMAEQRPGALGETALVVSAGLMHDLGKLFVPTSVLDAARRLTRDEMAIIRGHSESGAETLASLRFPEAVVATALDHHERWQGGGYPSGDRGTRTSPLTRAACVADSFIAMIEPGRAYRPRLTVAEAMAEVQACSGTQFDPDYARLLIEGLGHSFQQELGLDAAPGRWKPRDGQGLLLSYRLEHALGLPPCPW